MAETGQAGDAWLASKQSPTRGLSSRSEIQAKTFTKWINAHLRQCNASITNLFEDLRDGVRLLQLTEVLTGEHLRHEKGQLRVHHLANINRALDYLQVRKHIKLVNISPAHLAEGNEKLTLGLIWTLIQHFHIAASAEQAGGDQWADAKGALLEWCKRCVAGYSNVEVKNFSSSWQDGRAFNAIVHRFRPDLVDFANLRTASDPSGSEAARADLRALFAVADSELGVDALLEAEDVNVDNPDDRSIMMYVAMLRNKLGDLPEDSETVPDNGQASDSLRKADFHQPESLEKVPEEETEEEEDGEEVEEVEERWNKNGEDADEEKEPLLRREPSPSNPERSNYSLLFALGLAVVVVPLAVLAIRKRWLQS